MLETEKTSLHHLDSLLCLIKLKENEFFQINDRAYDRSHVLLFSHKSKGHNKISSIISQHGEESGRHVCQFWGSLKKVMKDNLERAERQFSNHQVIARYYHLIIKRIRKYLVNDSPLKKYLEIQGIINKKLEQVMAKSNSADHQASSPFPRNKGNQILFTSTKRKKSLSINNLATPNLKQKLSKKPIEELNAIKRLKKKHQKENKKFMETTTRLNNKLFKDLHLQGSLERFDCNKTRKVNSAIIYGDLMARNLTIRRNINKFQTESTHKYGQPKHQKGRFCNSFINQESMSNCCKTLRKTDTLIRKKKLPPVPGVLKLPSLGERKVKLLKRPLTAKQSKQDAKTLFPPIHKPRKNFLSLRAREFEMYVPNSNLV